MKNEYGQQAGTASHHFYMTKEKSFVDIKSNTTIDFYNFSQNLIVFIKMPKKKNNNNIQLIILGDSTVGKTSILKRCCDEKNFDNEHINTLGLDFKKCS